MKKNPGIIPGNDIPGNDIPGNDIPGNDNAGNNHASNNHAHCNCGGSGHCNCGGSGHCKCGGTGHCKCGNDGCKCGDDGGNVPYDPTADFLAHPTLMGGLEGKPVHPCSPYRAVPRGEIAHNLGEK